MNKLCECGCGKEVSNEKNKFINRHSRKNQKHSLESKLKISKNNAKIMLGKHHTQKTKLKIAKSNTGHHPTQETRLKMSIAHKGHITPLKTREKMSIAHKGKIRSLEHSKNLSISMIKHIEKHQFNGKIMRPCIGKFELSIGDQIENAVGLKSLRNDNKIAHKIGKFLDLYFEHYNLDIEILENHHFKPNGELSNYDKNRELTISSSLNCMIYYIPEQEFLKNPDKEIQRLKDFLKLLDEGRN